MRETRLFQAAARGFRTWQRPVPTNRRGRRQLRPTLIDPLEDRLLLATAASVTFSASVPLQVTNFDSTVSIPRFNPALGTLTGISFELEGRVVGNFKYENLGPTPSTITGNLQATLTLQR